MWRFHRKSQHAAARPGTWKREKHPHQTGRDCKTSWALLTKGWHQTDHDWLEVAKKKKKLHLDLLAIIRHLEWCYKHGGRGWMGWSRAVEERNRGSVFILLRLWIPPVMASVVGDKERLASSCSALLCLRRIHSAGFYFRLPQWISTSDACLIVELSSIELYRLDDFWSYHVEKLERPYVSTCLW